MAYPYGREPEATDAPDAPHHAGSESMAIRVNSHGHVVGSVNAGGWTAVRGFLVKDGVYTTIEHPEAALTATCGRMGVCTG